jgi:hypothetical protein
MDLLEGISRAGASNRKEMLDVLLREMESPRQQNRRRLKPAATKVDR